AAQFHLLSMTSSIVDCSFCGDNPAAVYCSTPACSRNILCRSCDSLWHGHPNRKNHVTEPYHQQQSGLAITPSSTEVSSRRFFNIEFWIFNGPAVLLFALLLLSLCGKADTPS
ncbi:hypothetical protein BOX15_Mlig033964g1, partial [Macrostomum lignano]